MKINRKNFFVGVVYMDKCIPDEIILGKFLYLFALESIGWILKIVLGLVLWCLAFLMCFPVAARPFLSGNEDAPIVKYKHWPRVRGLRIWPIWLIIASVVVAVVFADFPKIILWILILYAAIAMLLTFKVEIANGQDKEDANE